MNLECLIARMPCTNTLHKVMTKIPLATKGVNNTEALKRFLMFDKHTLIDLHRSQSRVL